MCGNSELTGSVMSRGACKVFAQLNHIETYRTDHSIIKEKKNGRPFIREKGGETSHLICAITNYKCVTIK